MWSKLDDKLHMHEKARRAFQKDPAAIGLWTMCLSYCGDQLTDGFVPAWYVATLIPGRKGIKLADILVDVGLWERTQLEGEKGWNFHDFLDQNPSKEKVLSDREYRRLQKAEQRKNARGEFESHGDSPETLTGSLTRPDPTRPDPTRSGGPSGHGVVGNPGTAHARARGDFDPDSGAPNGHPLDDEPPGDTDTGAVCRYCWADLSLPSARARGYCSKPDCLARARGAEAAS